MSPRQAPQDVVPLATRGRPHEQPHRAPQATQEQQRRSGPRPRSRPASGLGGPAPGAALTSLARRWPVPGRAPDRLLGRHGDGPGLAQQPQSALEEVADLAEAPADAGLCSMMARACLAERTGCFRKYSSSESWCLARACGGDATGSGAGAAGRPLNSGRGRAGRCARETSAAAAISS